MKKALVTISCFASISVIGQTKDLVKEGYYIETGTKTLRATNSIHIKSHTHIKPGSIFKAIITPDIFTPWEVGTGSSEGMTQNGGTSENSRVLGKNHVGKEVVLWEAKPNSSSDADGGWNSKEFPIDHTKTYRFSVWLKKTNSNDGTSYLGCRSQDNILKLDGDVNNNPYFWHGDLPRLNRWYLVVGFVHGSGHTAKVNTGGVYDGTTGEKVRSTTDFKFKNTAKSVIHRSYLYYDTNTLDRQYFYRPRIDLVDGKEFTIKELLQINDNSKLVVSYDTAGNQTKAFYCGDPAFCTPVPKSAIKARKAVEEPIVDEGFTMYEDTDTRYAEDFIEEVHDDHDHHNAEEAEEPKPTNFELTLYPNPTAGMVTIKLNENQLSNIHSMRLYDVNSVLLQDISVNKSSTVVVDLTSKPAGVYFIHIHLHEGKSVTQKIIKK